MRRLILITLILLFNAVHLFCQPQNIFEEVEQEYRHALSYYWYGRYKDNSMQEFHKSRFYLRHAEEALKKIQPQNTNESSQKNSLHHEFAKLNETIDAMEEVCIENLNGCYPLYYQIKGQTKDYEYLDDPAELALEDALSNMILTPYFTKTIAEQMMFSIVLINPEDYVMEEVAVQYLTNKSRHIIVDKFKLVDFISESDLALMGDYINHPEVLAKICLKMGIDKIGVFNLTKEDVINGLVYWTSTFQTISKSGQFSPLVKSDGFKLDKRGTMIPNILRSLLYALTLIILFGVIVSVFVGIRKEKYTKTVKVQSILGSLRFFSVSLLLGFVVVSALLILVRPLIPSGDEFYRTVSSLLVWNLLLPFVLSLSPIILIYFLAAKFYNKGLHQMFNIFGVFSGAALAYTVLLLFFQLVKNNPLVDLTNVFIAVPFILLSTFCLTWLYREHFMKRIAVNAVVIILIAITLFLIALQLVSHVKFLELSWQHALIILAPMLAGLLLKSIFFVYGERNSRNIASSIDQRPVANINTIEQLKLFFEDPSKYVPVSTAEGHFFNFESLASQLFNTSPDIATVSLISGVRGVGKTRFLKEFENFLNRKGGYKVFYGDCDEFQDSNTIPYEPFVQSLGKFIGAGAFVNQNKKLAEIANRLKNVEIGPVSSIAAVFGSSDGQSDGADANEILQEILQSLRQWQIGNKVILILEDLQWIDDTTSSLLELLIQNICLQTDEFQNFRIILTVRSEGSKKIEQNPFFSRLFDIDKNILNLWRIEDSLLNSFDYRDYFSKLIEINNLNFNYQSELTLSQYFESYHYKTPLHFNQMMINIIDRGWIIKDHDEFKLSKMAQLDDLLPPDDLSRLYREKFRQLDPEMLKILVSAAYIGMTFEAKILASVWWGIESAEQRILGLFHNLQEAERLGLIIDKSDHDDVYEFTSRGLMAELRTYSISNPESHYNTDLKEGDLTLPQVVKEYHKRIIAAIENYKGQELNLNINLLCSVAKRCRYLDLHNKENRDRLIKYNTLAGSRCARAARLAEAIDYYKSVYSVISRKELNLVDSSYDEIRREVILELLQLYLDIGKEVLGRELFDDRLYINSVKRADYLNMKALILYRSGGSTEMVLSVMEEFRKIDKRIISPLQDVRATFTESLARSIVEVNNDEEKQKITLKHIQELENLLKHLDTINGKDLAIKELKGEVLNKLSWAYIFRKSNLALEYLDRRLQLILGLDQDVPFNNELRISLLDNINLRSLSRHSQISLKYNMGAYSAYFSFVSDTENQKKYLEKTIKINKELGDQKGVANNCYYYAECLRLIDRNNMAEIFSYYQEAYWKGKFSNLGLSFYMNILSGITDLEFAAGTNYWIQRNNILNDFGRNWMGSMNISDRQQLHILRHFATVDFKFKEKLISSLSNDKMNSDLESLINNALHEMGSKFNPKVFCSPKDLWEQIGDKFKDRIKLKAAASDKIEYFIEMEKTSFPHGIGYEGIVHFDTINKEEKNSLSREWRGKNEVWVLERNQSEKTWTISIILRKQNNGWKIATIFPGKIAPSLPDETSQDEKEYLKSKEFWEQHAFLQVGKKNNKSAGVQSENH